MTTRYWKSLCVAALAVILSLQMAGCGGSDTTATTGNTSATSDTAEGQELTASELAEFDGQEGRPAYVAVDGVVYDVSDSSAWPEGMHSRCNLGAVAGKDLSDVIDQAPSNMRSLLGQMPVVGSLVQ